VRSLALQGGPMTEAECAAFLRSPYADDALRLRAWDDISKDAAVQPGAEAEAELSALMRTIGR
jgi:predicted HD phosphohydrolase